MSIKKNLVIVAGTAALVSGVVAQNANRAGRDWPSPQADAGGTRFSTLTQINTNNVTDLTRAWTFHTGSGRFSVSPMVIDSVMYFSAPNGVYAVDAVTGEQIWKFVPPAPAGGAAPAGRGGGRAGASAAAPQAARGEPAADAAGQDAP